MARVSIVTRVSTLQAPVEVVYPHPGVGAGDDHQPGHQLWVLLRQLPGQPPTQPVPQQDDPPLLPVCGGTLIFSIILC